MQANDTCQSSKRRDHRPNDAERPWRRLNHQHPGHRPYNRVNGREPAPAGPVRRVRYGLSGDQQPHGNSMHGTRAGSIRPRARHAGGLRSGTGSHRLPANRAAAHATSAAFFIASTLPSARPGPASFKASTICDFGTWFR